MTYAKPGEHVEVSWVDAAAFTGTGDEKPFGQRQKSAGYVVFEDRRGVRISQSQLDGALDVEDSMTDIPRGWYKLRRIART